MIQEYKWKESGQVVLEVKMKYGDYFQQGIFPNQFSPYLLLILCTTIIVFQHKNWRISLGIPIACVIVRPPS